jgi:hypothetical protein
MLKKIGRENEKANELGFQEMVAILSPLSIYGDSRMKKLPILHNTRIHTLEGHLVNCRRSTIGRVPDERTSLSLDASLATRRVSSASKRHDASGSRLRPLSLRSWFCGSTK